MNASHEFADAYIRQLLQLVEDFINLDERGEALRMLSKARNCMELGTTPDASCPALSVVSNVITHERFQRPPVALAKRRGRLPRCVVSIRSVPRLKVGVLAEIVNCVTHAEDNGKRVRITSYDPANDGFHFECESLDGPIKCIDGHLSTRVWMQPNELRRLWTGNTTPSKLGAP